MPRYEESKPQKHKVLEALRKKDLEGKENPTMGFREIRRIARIGTDALCKCLRELSKEGCITTTTIGAHPKYYISEKGIEEIDSSEEYLRNQAKPKRKRYDSGNPSGPSATFYYKGISFSELNNVVKPEWEKFAQEVRKRLDLNAEIGFVGTIMRSDRKPSYQGQFRSLSETSARRDRADKGEKQ
jgi:DNA-binding PadR family transcriptional regulator